MPRRHSCHPPHIESLAEHYALMLRQKEMRSIPESQEAAWETVDLNSLSQGEFRSIGEKRWPMKPSGVLDFRRFSPGLA